MTTVLPVSYPERCTLVVRALILLFLITLALGGCSGTSGDDESRGQNNELEEEDTVERISLTGLAVKGLVRNARVRFYLVEDERFSEEAFAETSTDEEGSYLLSALSEEAYEGPVLVRTEWQAGATVRCDSSTGCDGPDGNPVAFGTDYALPQDFVMSAVIPYVDSQQTGDQLTTGHITSLTHIAARYLEGLTEIDRSVAASGNNRVRLLFGLDDDVDLTNTRPVDVTRDEDLADAGDDSILYGLLTAALANIADAENEDIADTLDDFADEFVRNNGQLLWNNKDATRVNDISVLDILNEAERIATAENIAGDAVTDLEDYQDDVEDKPQTVSDINPPVITVGDDQSVNAGDRVELNVITENAVASAVSVQWRQTEGSSLTLENSSTAAASFTAPEEGGLFEFRVVVTITASGLTAVERVKVFVKPIAGNGTALAGDYHTFITSSQIFSTVSNSNEKAEIRLRSEYNPDVTVTAESNTAQEDDLIVRTGSGQVIHSLITAYSPSLTGSDSGSGFSYPAALNENNLPGETENNDEPLEATTDSLNRVLVTLPERGEVQNNEYLLEFAQNVIFSPLRDDTWFAVASGAGEFYATDSTGQAPDENQLLAKQRDASLFLMTRKASGLSPAALTDQYGVVHLSLGMDEARVTDLISGTEFWDFRDDNTLTARFDITQTTTGTASVQMLAQVDRIESAMPEYQVLDPVNSQMLNSVRATNLPVVLQGLGDAGFQVSAVGRLSLPSLSSGGISGGVNGLISPDESIFHIAVSATQTVAAIDGNNIDLNAGARYWGIRVGAAAPDVNNERFRVKGIICRFKGESGQVFMDRAQGEIAFDAQGQASVSLDARTSGVSQRYYSISAGNRSIADPDQQPALQWDVETKAQGEVNITSNAHNLNGFLSDDGEVIVLRYRAEDPDDGHGILIGKRIMR